MSRQARTSEAPRTTSHGHLGTVCAGAAGAGSLAALAFIVSLDDRGGSSAALRAKALEQCLGAVILAYAKLALIVVGSGAAWGAAAGVALASLAELSGMRMRRPVAALAGGTVLALAIAVSFIATLIDSPANIVTLWPYDGERLDPIYDHFGPASAAALAAGLVALLVLPPATLLARAAIRRVRARSLRLPGHSLGTALTVTTAFGVVLPAVLIFGHEDAKDSPRSARPNVLIMIADSLRADRVGMKRDGEVVMPALTRLAARGTNFRSCFVPVARTTESIVTLLTSAWSQQHGIRVSWTDATHLAIPALPGLLAREGYETSAIGDWTATDLARFDMGFERKVTPPESWCLPTFIARGGRLTSLLVRLLLPERLVEWMAPEIAYSPGADASGLVRRHVHDELARAARSPRPFFMTVFTANTHAPYTARGEHLRRFARASYRGPNRFVLWAKTITDSVRMQERRLASDDLAQVEAIYDAAARTFDDDLSATLDDLARLDLERNTIVLVLSDHGTAFYERGSFGQGNEIVSDVSNRIPLVLYDPRVATPRTVLPVVREVDIAPTILDLVGVKAPRTMAGVSLRPYVEGTRRDLGLVAYGETGLWIAKQPWQDAELDFGFPPIEEMCEIRDAKTGVINVQERWVRLMIRAQQRMVRTERWKLVFTPTRTSFRIQLYEVARGDEALDVAAEHPDVVLGLFAILSRWLSLEPPDVWRDPLPAPGTTR